MALLAGAYDTADSMAKSIYDAVVAEFGAVAGELDTDRQRMAEAMAAGIVAHIVAHGDVRITTLDSGLQRDNTAGTPDTLSPVADRVLSGAIE